MDSPFLIRAMNSPSASIRQCTIYHLDFDLCALEVLYSGVVDAFTFFKSTLKSNEVDYPNVCCHGES